MPVVHIVLGKIKDSLDEDSAKQFKEACHSLAAEQELKTFYTDFKWGPPISDARSKGYNWGLYSVFTDRDALKQYNEHTLHTDFVKNVIRPNTEDLLAYDFDI